MYAAAHGKSLSFCSTSIHFIEPSTVTALQQLQKRQNYLLRCIAFSFEGFSFHTAQAQAQEERSLFK